MSDGADVTVRLAGVNTHRGGAGGAGLSVPAGTHLTVSGSGSLEVSGGERGAGIGGGIKPRIAG
ncbi:MAG: hypothetical protein MdMp014T_2160 [Treponematales bacterium]